MAFFFSKYNIEYLSVTKYMDGDSKLLVCDFDEIYTHCPVALTVTESLVMLTQFNEITPRVHEAGLLELWAGNMKSSSIVASAGYFSRHQGQYVKLLFKYMQPAFTFLFSGYALKTITFLLEGLTKCKILMNPLLM
jgi:hypothetical protein